MKMNVSKMKKRKERKEKNVISNDYFEKHNGNSYCTKKLSFVNMKNWHVNHTHAHTSKWKRSSFIHSPSEAEKNVLSIFLFLDKVNSRYKALNAKIRWNQCWMILFVMHQHVIMMFEIVHLRIPPILALMWLRCVKCVSFNLLLLFSLAWSWLSTVAFIVHSKLCIERAKKQKKLV